LHHLVLTKRRKMNQNNIPKDAELIDDTFYVCEGFALWKTIMKDTGEDYLFSLTKDDVVKMTRWILRCEKDGTLAQHTRVVNSGVVGGKL